MKGSSFSKKMNHGSGYFREILNESPIETGMPEETPDTFDSSRMRQFGNYINFCSVNLNSAFGNLIAEDNAFFDLKMEKKRSKRKNENIINVV